MMNRKLLTAGFGAALMLGMGACDPDKLTEVNENPNDPTEAPSPALFTTASRIATTRWLGGFDARGASLVAQHIAEVQYPETDQYRRLDASSTAGTFNGSYNAEIIDFQQIVLSATTANQPGWFGPAMVMRAWSFFNLTDVWGDVPYSQALKGAAGTLSPSYDAQKDIYTGLFADLDKASRDMAAAPAAAFRFGTADPIFGRLSSANQLPAWQRFSNSLRARQALRVVNVDRATADAQLRAAFAAPGGLITTNAQNAQLNWPGDGVYDNPWAANFRSRDDHRVSDRFINVLRETADPRVAVLAQRAEKDTTTPVTAKYCVTGTPCYVGLANALTHAEAAKLVPYTSRPSALLYPGATSYGTYGGSGSSYPSYLMTAAEVAFIQAEAAERGLGGLAAGQARGFYESGIRLSFGQWGLTDAQATAYIAGPAVAYAGGTPGLKQIAKEKWVALFAQGVQAWAEVRRTCYPSTVKPGPSAIIAEIPRRYTYSTTEYAVNAEAVAAAVARQGADNFLTRTYWDKAPTTAPTYEAGCGRR